MEIIPASQINVNDLIRLFKECFRDDHYYLSYLLRQGLAFDEWADSLKESFNYCLKQDYSFAILDNGSLVAFVLGFDYFKCKEKKPALFTDIFGTDKDGNLTYYEEFHQKVESLKSNGADTIYLLSIAVNPLYRRKGIATLLVDHILELYSDHNIVTDVSNNNILPVFSENDFSTQEIDKEYYYVSRLSDDLRNLYLALPARIETYLDKYDMAETGSKEFSKAVIPGYDIKETAKDSIPYYFKNGESTDSKNEESNEGKKSYIYKLSISDIRMYEKRIGLIDYQQDTIDVSIENANRKCILYYRTDEPAESPSPKEKNLINLLKKGRTREWQLTPDIYVSVSIEYTSVAKLENAQKKAGTIPSIINKLDDVTKYEAGDIGTKLNSIANIGNRIQRYYLGREKIHILTESDTNEASDSNLGADSYVDFYVSIDQNSKCGVLTWYSLSAPFLLSHLLDNVIRNRVQIGEKNLYEYLSQNYGIEKRGTPKSYVLFPTSKASTGIPTHWISSLLMSETIYPSGESFGKIIDENITKLAESKNGIGQYDRAYVYPSSNTLLQFSDKFPSPAEANLNSKERYNALLVEDRLEDSVSTLFYIELILFEESAIYIADRKIFNLLAPEKQNRKNNVEFLEEVNSINDDFSRTIDFWHIKLDYPSTQKSMEMLRSAFLIDQLITKMQRDYAQIQQMFEVKSDIRDRLDARRSNIVLTMITLLTTLSILPDYTSFLSDYLMPFIRSFIPQIPSIVIYSAGFIALVALAIFISYLLNNQTAEHKKNPKKDSKPKKKKA